MKWIPRPFKSDLVEFTLIDLIKLAFGCVLKDSALIAVRKGVKHDS